MKYVNLKKILRKQTAPNLLLPHIFLKYSKTYFKRSKVAAFSTCFDVGDWVGFAFFWRECVFFKVYFSKWKSANWKSQKFSSPDGFSREPSAGIRGSRASDSFKFSQKRFTNHCKCQHIIFVIFSTFSPNKIFNFSTKKTSGAIDASGGQTCNHSSRPLKSILNNSSWKIYSWWTQYPGSVMRLAMFRDISFRKACFS